MEYSMKLKRIFQLVDAESSFWRVLEILDEIYILFTVRTGQIGQKKKKKKEKKGKFECQSFEYIRI